MSWSWLVRLQFMFRGTVIYDRGMKAVGAQEFQVLLVMTHRLMCIAHCWFFEFLFRFGHKYFWLRARKHGPRNYFQPSSLSRHEGSRGTGGSGFASHDASLDVHCRLLVLLNLYSDSVTNIFDRVKNSRSLIGENYICQKILYKICSPVWML